MPVSHKKFKAKAGGFNWARNPTIRITADGKKSYIWVGNDEGPIDSLCYCTLSGPKALEKFAKELLKALKEKQWKKKPTPKKKAAR